MNDYVIHNNSNSNRFSNTIHSFGGIGWIGFDWFVFLFRLHKLIMVAPTTLNWISRIGFLVLSCPSLILWTHHTSIYLSNHSMFYFSFDIVREKRMSFSYDFINFANDHANTSVIEWNRSNALLLKSYCIITVIMISLYCSKKKCIWNICARKQSPFFSTALCLILN